MSEIQHFIELYNGMEKAGQDRNDWGETGPIFCLGANLVQITYATDIKFEVPNIKHLCFLYFVGDEVYYDGVYYGDVCIFMADPFELEDRLRLTGSLHRLTKFHQAKAENGYHERKTLQKGE